MRRPGLASCLALPLALAPWSAAVAQGWGSDLQIDPFPSPYFSDWDVSADVASFTVYNNTGAESSVRLTFNITGKTRGVVASGLSDPVTMAPGPNPIDSPFELSGSFDYDVDIQDLVVRTGRFPEGDYTACAAVTDLSGFVLTQACSSFSVVYPDPPTLLSPFDGERVTTQDPFFEWTPLQVPLDYPVHFTLQVAEVLPGQTPLQALTSNVPQFEEADLTSTDLQYPLGALPFTPGTRYAWRIQAIDGNGYAATANAGMSEIHTFVYVEGTEAVARVRISPGADTLGFSGDAARLVATAYDENDFELPDAVFAWTSSDTTVVRVDSLGRITSAGEGEAEIVAVADGVADTARAVALTGGGAGLRISFYDPQTETPEPWSLLQSASYDQVVDWIEQRMKNGVVELPLPVAGLAAGGGGEGDDGAALDRRGKRRYAAIDFGRGERTPGPSAPAAGVLPSAPAAACGSLTLPFAVYRDDDKRAIALHMRAPADVAASLFDCLGIADWNPDRPGQKLELMLSLVFPPKQGAAEAFLGIKLPFVGLLENQPGIHLDYAVLVLNLWRGFEVDPATLPAEAAAFYPYKFKVKGIDVERQVTLGESTETKTETTGIGALNFYGRLDLTRTPIVGLLKTLGFQEPVIELHGDLSQAREGGLLSQATRVSGATSAPDTLKGGTAFHIEGELPKRVPQIGAISRYITSTQIGIELEIASEWAKAKADSGASAPPGETQWKVTPKLTHTIELQLPFPNWPPLTLQGSAAWSSIAEASSTASASDTAAAGADSTATGNGGTPAKSKWTLAYEVGTGEDTTILVWDFLHLKLGAEATFTRSTSASPAAWELKLSGTGGFGSADEALTASVAYGRESANCGGKNEPACKTPEDTATGQPRPAELSKAQSSGQWTLTLGSKGIALGALLKDLRRLSEAIH